MQTHRKVHPVTVRARHDGWTAEKPFALVGKLADRGGVSAPSREPTRPRTRRLAAIAAFRAGPRSKKAVTE